MRSRCLSWSVGIIDGTCRRIYRPDNDQREFYAGHKRCQALKYRGVATPDGLIIYVHGPFKGKRHEAGVFAGSGLSAQLEQHINMPGGGAYTLYGDAAYPVSVYLQKGYQGAVLTPDQQAFNTRLSSVRQAVEWSFGQVRTDWAFFEMKRQQEVGLQPVGLYYQAGVLVLLTNAKSCLHRGKQLQTSDTFRMPPPTLAEFLQARGVNLVNSGHDCHLPPCV